MPSSLRVGVIGLGFGQHVHVPAFRLDPRCQVHAICGSTPERAAAVASRHGIPRAHGDWRELVADPAIDIVSIAVPPALQDVIALDALRRGKAVFCEKPVAIDTARAVALLDAARASGAAHAVDFLFPELPAWAAARAVVEGGTLGALRSVALSWRVETHAIRHGLDSWKRRREDGGGTMNNFVSHALHNVEWLFGPIERMIARLAPPLSEDIRVEAWLECRSGLPVTLSVATDAYLGSGHRIEVYGDLGTLVLKNETADHARGFELYTGLRDQAAMQRVQIPSLQEGDGRVLAAAPIVSRLVDAMVGGPPVTPNLEHGVRVQELLASMERSSTGAWQRVGR